MSRTYHNWYRSAEIHVHHRVVKLVPEWSQVIAYPEIQGEIVIQFEVVLRVVSLCPAEQVHMRVAAGHFGIVADAQQ